MTARSSSPCRAAGRRKALIAAASVAAAALMPFAAMAQQKPFPHKPLRWLVGYPPGGGSDAIARLVAQSMSQTLGQSVIVDNRPGASANIAGDLLVKSAPDGYTMMNPDNGLLVYNPVMYKSMSFNPARDMKPVGGLARLNLVVVVAPDSPIKTLGDLLEEARRSSAGLQYAASSMGSPLHLTMERLAKEAKVTMTHVPYRGAGPAVTDMLAGIVKIMCIDYGSASQYIKAGTMRPIAVASKNRIAALPNVPTFIEAGVKGFESYAWQGVVVPANTPDETVATLNLALNKALGSKAVVDKLTELGIEPTATTPAALTALVRSEQETWQPLVRALDIRLD